MIPEKAVPYLKKFMYVMKCNYLEEIVKNRGF
jgi:hypothetical protein